MQFSPSSFYFYLRSKYFPQHFIVEHPQHEQPCVFICLLFINGFYSYSPHEFTLCYLPTQYYSATSTALFTMLFPNSSCRRKNYLKSVLFGINLGVFRICSIRYTDCTIKIFYFSFSLLWLSRRNYCPSGKYIATSSGTVQATQIHYRPHVTRHIVKQVYPILFSI
jgi:hypothetical protein